MRFELFIAARYLRAKRRQAVVGVITAISVAGVAAGRRRTHHRARHHDRHAARSAGPPARLYLARRADAHPGDGMRDWRPLVARCARCRTSSRTPPGSTGRYWSHAARAPAATISKASFPTEEQPRHRPSRHGEARFGAGRFATGCPPVIAGRILRRYRRSSSASDLADHADANVGDTVLVTSPQGELTPLGIVPKFQRFYVAGIFHSGFYQYDSSLASSGCRMRSACSASLTHLRDRLQGRRSLPRRRIGRGSSRPPGRDS